MRLLSARPLSENAKSPNPSQAVDTLRGMLSPRDKSILDFEGSWWLYPGPKDRAISEYLDVSATRYYQALRRLIDDDEAYGHDPLTVRRLRKVRDARLERIAAQVGDQA
jgi:Protein of unknown function (DUF3263)